MIIPRLQTPKPFMNIYFDYSRCCWYEMKHNSVITWPTYLSWCLAVNTTSCLSLSSQFGHRAIIVLTLERGIKKNNRVQKVFNHMRGLFEDLYNFGDMVASCQKRGRLKTQGLPD